MELQVRPVTSRMEGYSEIARIYNGAFPRRERLPIRALLLMARRKNVDFWAFYDGDIFCGLTYLMGGGLHEIEGAIRNVIADVSGVICDGAKAGCSLKIATAVSSACRCSMLALHGSAAGNLDGIVCEDVERTIDNLGGLGAEGMAGTDQVILDMMVCKS